ncbi:MAG: AAA family ATPase [Candidatus Doudnabacteria bacterium]|nr:AAA family ATPase [Candidatus Doudnabacteria bacterium]
MYLKRLELQGFKSFAHKTVLDFEPGTTAVVGPNGSGKSNVADALRWVMGEQSLKLLRGKKTEDVIFAGSDKKSKLSVAEVALTFDNKDHRIPVEYAEVEIRRRVYRNGESEYLMNGNRVRLLDVVEALMRSGFGATNYAVIGQGTIDQMILAGPAEIKNLVEEAAGVKPYYMKKEKTVRRLEQTEENLSRVSELLAEIEPRLRSLKRQAKRMEEREIVAAELKTLQKEFFGHQLHLLETEISALSGKIETKQDAITRLSAEISSFTQKIEKEEQQSGRADTFLDELDKKLKTLEQRRLVLAENLAEIKGKLKAESPAVKNFSEFQRQFESILELLRPETIEEVRTKLKELVVHFSESKSDELQKQKQDLTLELEQIIKEMDEEQVARSRMILEEKQKKSFLTGEEKNFRIKSSELAKLKDETSAFLVEKARLDTRLEGVNKELMEALGNEADLSEYKKTHIGPEVAPKITRLKHQLELAGGVDESTLAEYRETQERFDYLTTQSADLSKGVVDLRSVIEELDQIIKKQFDEAFEKISVKFVEYFRILFNGGKAQMSLLRSSPEAEDGMEEMLEESEEKEIMIDGVRKKKVTKEIVGIEIKATPPGKKLATIAALSGGERALTSIALLCAMLAAYPSPFVVLDEVDAALDEANSIRFAKILGTLAHQTQFITITHNRETMRQAHTLYGVTMSEEGISKILSVKLEQAVSTARP